MGDSGVGKSSIMKRFTRDEFDLTPEATLGFEYDNWFMIVNGIKT